MDLGQLRGLVTEGANLKVGLGVGEREWGRKILDFASLVSREGAYVAYIMLCICYTLLMI